MSAVYCQNCDWEGTEDECDEIEDYEQRVGAGESAPAGQCPECGCLCQLEQTNEDVLDEAVRALHQLQYRQRNDGHHYIMVPTQAYRDFHQAVFEVKYAEIHPDRGDRAAAVERVVDLAFAIAGMRNRPERAA